MSHSKEAPSYRVLLVDDDDDLLHLISVRLKANHYLVNAVSDAEKALSLLPVFKPHVVITDLKMPGMDGLALFREIQERHLGLPVIVLTAHGTIPDAVAAVQEGVFSYLVKPFDATLLLSNLEKALKHRSSDAADDEEGQEWRKFLIYQSHIMNELLDKAAMAADSASSILIQSETGTGKELLARAIHVASPRRQHPFLTLNCAAMPETLIESELFGHSPGAYTGATRHGQPGIFEAANKGTVFLDEIGDMPPSAQAKLLRVLEQKEIRRLGSTDTVPVDVRIIAATHRNLLEMISQGEFREDLYYRLNVISLELPPLSQRREDIPLLANHFCQQFAERNNKPVRRFSPEAAELLLTAPWPGNVRQLSNVVEQCVVLSPTPIISRQLVERSLRFKHDRLLGLNDAREQFEREYLIRLLNLTEGNIALASRLAERNRSEFYKLLNRHGLEPAQFRAHPEGP